MTADKIRKLDLGAEDRNKIEMLREIAAQLAESNELKRLEVEAINNLCGTINLLSHEGHPVSKAAGSLESIAVSLDILVNRARI